MTEITTREELTKAGIEWLEQQVESGREHFPKVFTIISMNDYNLLGMMSTRLNLKESKVYLKDIAELFGLPMKDISPRIQRLQDMGHVSWKHDKTGTYITITESGLKSMDAQKERLIDFIEASVKEYGLEKFKTLIEYRGELNRTMEKIVAQM